MYILERGRYTFGNYGRGTGIISESKNNDSELDDNKHRHEAPPYVWVSIPFTAFSMSPQDPQNAALVAHIVSQIEQNVNFLAAQNYISNGDASAILSRLPNSNQDEIVSRAADLNIGTRNIPPPAMPRPTPAPPTATLSRALWAYNENGQVFLSFIDLQLILMDHF